MLVLSLFPGIGLLDRAFEEEGFCVVRGPDLLWGGDVRSFHPPAGRFDGVIGGPPCPAHSTLRHVVHAAGRETAPDLIPDFERCIREAAPTWFLMEQVPQAPLPEIRGYHVQDQLVRDVWVGGATNRLRRFSFGWLMPSVTEGTRRLPYFGVEQLALHQPEPELSILASGPQYRRETNIPGRKSILSRGSPSRTSLAKALRDQGLPADLFEGSPLTMEGKYRMIGNGVPLPMGRAVARAVKAALGREAAA